MRVDRAGIDGLGESEIVAERGVDRHRTRRQRRIHVGDRRQLLPIRRGSNSPILGLGSARRRHRDDRLAFAR